MGGRRARDGARGWAWARRSRVRCYQAVGRLSRVFRGSGRGLDSPLAGDRRLVAEFKIGEFFRLARVSVKALRHYDRLGLLRPIEVDRFTNYRRYSLDQLPRPGREVYLRTPDQGEPLAEVQVPVARAA